MYIFSNNVQTFESIVSLIISSLKLRSEIKKECGEIETQTYSVQNV